MNYELDPIYETMGLLYFTYNPNHWDREALLEDCREIGLNETAFVSVYDKVRPLLEQYASAFQERMVKSEIDLFFYQEEQESKYYIINLTLFLVILNNRHWLESLEEIEDSMIYEAVAKELLEEVPKTTQELIQKLKMEEYTPQVCWKFLLILESPKSYMEQWLQTIKKNIPACEYAMEVVQDVISPLLTKFHQPSAILASVESFIGDELQVRPSFIWPTAFNLLKEDLAYSGLFMGEVAKILDRKNNPESIAQAFKVFGDQSKLEILQFLKEGPKYNLEIANQLGVTAATTSHHMNTLFTQGFVKLIKQGNKTYYSLEEERIPELIADLNSILL